MFAEFLLVTPFLVIAACFILIITVALVCHSQTIRQSSGFERPMPSRSTRFRARTRIVHPIAPRHSMRA